MRRNLLTLLVAAVFAVVSLEAQTIHQAPRADREPSRHRPHRPAPLTQLFF